MGSSDAAGLSLSRLLLFNSRNAAEDMHADDSLSYMAKLASDPLPPSFPRFCAQPLCLYFPSASPSSSASGGTCIQRQQGLPIFLGPNSLILM